MKNLESEKSEQVVENIDVNKSINKERKIDKILNNIVEQAVSFSIPKDESMKDLWEKSKLGDKSSLDEFKEKIKGLWKDFTVHGIVGFDRKENKVFLKPKTDLDGRVSIGLLNKAGFNTDNIKYVTPGEYLPGTYNMDTGFKKGFSIDSDKESGAVTLWRDHHGGGVEKETVSAARLVYLEMRALGLLKKDEIFDKLTQFTSMIDRAAYPDQEKLFWKSGKMVLGLYESMDFDDLYDYFKAKRSPEEELSPDDLRKYKLEKESKKKEAGIAETKEKIKELEKGGFIMDSGFGKIIVDIDKKFPGGYLGSLACGYNGYLLFNQLTESFVLSVKPVSEKEEDKKKSSDLSGLNIPQSVVVKKNMVLRPMSETPLNISLKGIVDKIGGLVEKGSDLEKSINGLEIRNSEFITEPELSEDKKGVKKWISRGFDKLAIFPKNFKPEKGRKYKVRVKYNSNPGEKKGVYYLDVPGDIAGGDNEKDKIMPDFSGKQETENEINGKEKELSIKETKREKLERLRNELKKMAETGGMSGSEATANDIEKIRKTIKDLDEDIKEHRKEKFRSIVERPEKRRLRMSIRRSGDPENKSVEFEKLESLRDKEREDALARKIREKGHYGQSEEAVKMAKEKFIKTVKERKERDILVEISVLEKMADELFRDNKKAEAIAVLDNINNLKKELEVMKAGGVADKPLEDTQKEAIRNYKIFIGSKNGIKELGVFYRPKKASEVLGHILTAGIFYGATSIYRYFKGRKARAVARLDYEANLLNYKKSSRDLFFKLSREITKEWDLSMSYIILKGMAKNEKDKMKRGILENILKGYTGLVISGSMVDENRYPKISFIKINTLVNTAKNIGLY